MAHAEPGSRYPMGCEDGGNVPQDQGRQNADGVPGGPDGSATATDCGARPHEPSTHPPGAPDTHSHETTDAATFHTANAGNQVGDQRATSMAFP